MKKKKSNLSMMKRKIGIMFTLILFFQSFNVGVCHAQSADEPKLTVEFKGTPFVEVLNYIKRHTKYEPLYNNEEMKKIPIVTRNFKSTPLSVVLQQCLEGTEYTYRFFQNMLVIQKRQKTIEPVTVRVKVLDEKSEALPGATVLVKGTTIGGSTNHEGIFVFNLPKMDTVHLVVSFVGMETQEAAVSNFDKETVVRMKPDTKEMEEVVVTGFGNVKRSSFTGNAVTVTREELLRVSKTNVIKALEVYDPSFRIKTNNQWGSDPNALPEMQIRGQSSIGVKDLDRNALTKSALENNPNLPIFILDGFEVSIEKVYDMDPNRIEAMYILKDAAATALYGSRAANGVVVITTVAPQVGQIFIDYSLVGSITMPDLSDYNLMHSAEKLEAEVTAGLFEPHRSYSRPYFLWQEYNEKLLNVLRGVDTYWLSKPLRSTFNHKHSLYFEGGTEAMRYGLDFQYNNEDGVMKGSYRNRTGAGFEFVYTTGKFEVRNYVSYGETKAKDSPYGLFSQYTKLLPYDEYKDENGKYLKELPYWNGRESIVNPLYEAQLGSYNRAKSTDITDNIRLNWYILPSLQIKGELSVNHTTDNQEIYVHPDSQTQVLQDRNEVNLYAGTLNKTNAKATSWETKLMAYYNETIDKHHLNVSGGINIRTSKSEGENASYRGFPTGGEYVSVNFAKEIVSKPTQNESRTRLFGILGMVNYSFDNTYLFDASLRFDGSSQFGKDKRWAPLWAVGVGINLHKYEVFSNLGWMELFKIRGSFGSTGKTNFQTYEAIPTHTIDIEEWYITGAGASLMDRRGNRKLKWETTDKLDMSIELGIFNNLLYLKGEYYHEVTNGMIENVTLPSSTGFRSYKSNVGKVLNEGFAVDLRSTLLSDDKWYVAVYANLAHNVNKLKKVSDALKEYNQRVDEYYSDPDNDINRSLTKYEEGVSLSAKYGMKSLGIDPANGQDLFVYRDGTVSYDWSPTQMVKIGDLSPWGTGSFGVNLRYRGFTLFTSFMFEFGGDEYNYTLVERVENANMGENVDKRAVTQRWQKPGDITTLKDIKDRNETTRPTSRFMQRNNTLTWNSLNVGYELPQEMAKKIGLRVVRFEVGANDLWRVSTIKAERGIDYPYAHTMNFSLKLQF